METEKKVNTNEEFYNDECFYLNDSTVYKGNKNQLEKRPSSNDRNHNGLQSGLKDMIISDENIYAKTASESSIAYKLLNEYLPPCMVTDTEGRLLYVSGDAGKYLRIPSGEISFSILKMIPNSLINIVKSGIERVIHERSDAVYSNIVFELDNKAIRADLKFKLFDKKGNHIIIFIIENTGDYNSIENKDDCIKDIIKKDNGFNCAENNNAMNNNRHEPEDSYGYGNINGFLTDYFAGSVLLDMNLCVKKYTPTVKNEINLMDYHVGRPINHITHNFENENLAQNAIRVLNSLVSIENEVRSIYGKWYILRYSPSYEYGNRVNGIVISLLNVTRSKNTHNKFYRLSQAVEQSSSMVMITNIDGKIEYVNPRFTEVTGYTSEEITGRDFGILKSGLQEARVYKDLRETIMSGKEWKGELCSKKKNGDIFWEMASISPVRDKDGVITHFIEIKEDITGIKSDVEALKNSEEKYRQVFNSLKDLVFLYDVNVKGVPSKLIEVNKVARNILGYTEEELRSMNLYDLIDEESIVNVHKINQNILSQGYSSFEVSYLCKNGYRLPAKVNCHVFTSSGRRVVLMIARDISEQKDNEEALLKSKERYEFLVEYSPYAILIASNGIVLFSNIAGQNMFKFKNLNEIVGKPIKSLFNIDFRKLMNEQNIFADVEGKQAAPLEDRIIRSDGTSIFVEITTMPFFFDGKSATLLMVRDITSRKQAEELQKDIERSKKLLDETIEYDTLKTEFFSNISHELRTPLNGLISTLQLLSMHLRENTILDQSNKIARYSGIMRQNSYRLLRLVNNMIDITRIDTGFLDLSLQNCNIVSIIEDITMSVAEFVGDKKIALIFDTDIEEKIMAFDPDKIERIMLNLLSNAIKFIKNNGQINVNLYDRDGKILITVRDTGIGIPEDKLGMIFERFRQVDKSLTRNHEGSGMGLSLVKSLVEMHGGKICVSSELGKGSEFSVELPSTVLPEDNSSNKVNDFVKRDNYEKVCIEFSDIYDL